MKRKYMYLFISIMLLTTGVVYSKEVNNKLIGKVIVLDAGHGGKDKGTSVDNVYESDINLDIILKLRNALVKQGVEVILTRDGDFDLSSPSASRRKKSDFDNRIKLINESKADFYISVHMNYLNDSRYYGAQVFYVNGNEKVANVFQDKFINYLKSPMKAKELNDSIYMYKKLTVPGVLIECGFLSNSNERILLKSDEYQDKIVDVIIKSLLEYY